MSDHKYIKVNIWASGDCRYCSGTGILHTNKPEFCFCIKTSKQLAEEHRDKTWENWCDEAVNVSNLIHSDQKTP
jgi:hypothetical protein